MNLSTSLSQGSGRTRILFLALSSSKADSLPNCLTRINLIIFKPQLKPILIFTALSRFVRRPVSLMRGRVGYLIIDS